MLHVPGMPEGVHVSFSPEQISALSPGQPAPVGGEPPVFDIEKWMAELESVGGGLCPPTAFIKGGAYFPIYSEDDERTAVLARLSDEFDRNKAVIRSHINRIWAK